MAGAQSYQNDQLALGSKNQSIRHLVALVDGTWVSASRKSGAEKHSNVYKIGLYINFNNEANEQQIAFYSAGLGSKTAGNRNKNGLFASDFSLEVEKVYINFCINYCCGDFEAECDKIYLFGFSRGALIARVVAEIIDRYGFLRPTQIQMFPYIWQDFMETSKIRNLVNFKETYCVYDGKSSIEFLGLFDMVCGKYSGPDRRFLNKFFSNNKAIPKNVKATVHLLARNETRRMFKPIIFKYKEPYQHLEQIWMPGVHSDVGGGYTEDFFSKIALMTMLDRVRHYTYLQLNFGVSMALRASIEEAFGQNRIVINNENKGLFWFLKVLFGGATVKDRSIDSDDACQLIHPIYQQLVDREFVDKKYKTQLFFVPAFPFKEYARVRSLENLEGISI